MSEVTEGAVPPPPPDPVPEAEGMEPTPFGRRLWDYVTLFDGMTEIDLFETVPVPSGAARREYQRWTGIKTVDWEVEHRAYFDRGLRHAYERGWLIAPERKGGKVTAGEIPPDHTPMTQIGNETTLRATLDGELGRKAIALLTSKNGARQMSIIRRADLKKSLQTVGQLYPILRWSPVGVMEPIIVDGRTRLEEMTKLGWAESAADADKGQPVIEFRDLPRSMTPLEVLQMRITSELVSTSKDQRDEARNEYIEMLAKERFKQAEIAKLVGISQQRVSQVLLSTVQADLYRGQPTPDEVDEFMRLRDAGWNVRAIAETSGWSRGTVQNYLSGTREPKPPSEKKGGKATKPKPEPKQRWQDDAVITAAAKKNGMQAISIGKTSSAKVVATIDGRPEYWDDIWADHHRGQFGIDRAGELPDYLAYMINLVITKDPHGVARRLVEQHPEVIAGLRRDNDPQTPASGGDQP